MEHPTRPTPPAPLRGRPATPGEEAWQAFRFESEQETPKRLEEAAKFLSGMISIALTIFLTRDEKVFQQAGCSGLVSLATWLWLGSLVMTFLVIFPFRWQQASPSADHIAQIFRASVRLKYRLLVIGMVLFLAALGLLAWVYAGSAVN